MNNSRFSPCLSWTESRAGPLSWVKWISSFFFLFCFNWVELYWFQVTWLSNFRSCSGDSITDGIKRKEAIMSPRQRAAAAFLPTDGTFPLSRSLLYLFLCVCKMKKQIYAIACDVNTNKEQHLASAVDIFKHMKSFM